MCIVIKLNFLAQIRLNELSNVCVFSCVKNGQFVSFFKRRFSIFDHHTFNTSIASFKQYYSVAKAFKNFL